MKLKAGRDIDVGGDVVETSGDTRAPWYENKTAAWLTVTLALIVTIVIFYLVSGKVEVVFAELIGVALGYLATKASHKSGDH